MSAGLYPPTEAQRLAERQRPAGPVVLWQRWENLLFLHWHWEAATVQSTLPTGLTVDTHDGWAWVGIVPVFMRDVRPRFVPPVPLVSDFLELNVRTYVYDAWGRPGIYFYSLDCNQPLAVETARRLLYLRYEHADIAAGINDQGWINFTSRRKGSAEAATFRYHPIPPAAEAASGTAEFFLLERYRLFTADEAGERLHAIRVCHAPYQVQPAQVYEWSESPLRQAGLDPRGRAPDHICAAQTVEAETFAPERLESS
ncbi:MAG: hypothetical protein RIQ93_1705 [Verrucomicrobiota bacterium]|jgi:uncharacterized protein YqjF (DUF2071 family)